MEETKDSPAIQLMTVLWNNRQQETGHSWLRMNQSLHSGLMLAVEMGLRFHVDDLGICLNRFRGGYWFGCNMESFYTRAVLYGNASAWKCYEYYTERKPFIWKSARYSRSQFGGGRMGSGLARLVEGADFLWNGERVTVTSFNDAKGSFTACSYVREDGARDQKISHRYTITHDDLKSAKKNGAKA